MVQALIDAGAIRRDRARLAGEAAHAAGLNGHREIWERLLKSGGRPLPSDDPEAVFLRWGVGEVQSFSAGGHRWSLESNALPGTEEIVLRRNGAIVRRLHPSRRGSSAIAARKTGLSVGFPVVAARYHGTENLGELTEFYAITGGRLVKMGEIEGRAGGPLLEDHDGDGRPEWIFDDHDPYARDGSGPRRLRIYRVSAAKRLVLWKRVPNPSREPLPRVLGNEQLQ